MEFKINLGIAEDTRSDEAKALDYKHETPAGGIVINWVEKDPKDLKKYTPREQDGSLSCMAQAAAKAFEIYYKIVMSAHPLYRSRINYPAGGMYTQDLGNVSKNPGTTTEELDPSQWQNESKMNRVITVQTPYKIYKYLFVNPQSIDEVAQAIELYKHCILVVHCDRFEWTAVPEFKGTPYDFGHGICAVDYLLYQGQKAVSIEDSTGHFNSMDGYGQRIITEDFLKKRFVGAMYLIFEAPIPKIQLTQTLRVGSKGLEVRELQQLLNIKVDGVFGPITKSAVIAFQSSHQLAPDGVVGPKTRAVLNAL